MHPAPSPRSFWPLAALALALAGCASAPAPQASAPAVPAAPLPAPAGTAPAEPDAQQAGFAAWLAEVEREAIAQGLRPATVRQVLGSAQLLPRVIELDRAQPEFTRTPWAYLDAAVSPQRIAQGQAQRTAHRAALEAAATRYGVPSAIVTAIWGMESNYGQNFGSFRTVDALATLGFEGRRRAWARRELLAALRILDQGDIAPERMQGSWAGAMGHTQWMPEVWLNMGVDFDGDGRVSPFGAPDDSFAGTARYLVERGKWRRGEAWGYEVTLDPRFDFGLADGKTQRPIAEWLKQGVRRANGQAFPRPTDLARLSIPAGAKGPAFALLPNFWAVKSYNPSYKYALAICHLSDKIRGGGALLKAWPTDERLLSLAETQELQERLTALGFDTGGTDGRFGEKTQYAIQSWQKSVGMAPADGYPSDIVLSRLRGG